MDAEAWTNELERTSIRYGAEAPEPLPIKDLVEADLWDQLPADRSALLAILTSIMLTKIVEYYR